MCCMIFFDLEGPLSSQDNAYEVLSLAENGRTIFEAISRYDDILTLGNREGYEPGDTLKLIVPFLIHNGITEDDIKKVSGNADVMPGAREVIADLKEGGWNVHIISTSYQQHAFTIAEKVGVSKDMVACTAMPLDKYANELEDWDFKPVNDIEDKILRGMGEEEAVKVFDDFFFRRLQRTPMGRIFNDVRVIGGQRKVNAMLDFIEKGGGDMARVVAVGDSITDYKMLKYVRENRGLAIVFNGNEYAVPYADIGLASVDQRFILPITSPFMKEGKEGALYTASKLESGEQISKLLNELDAKYPPVYSKLEGTDKSKIDAVVKTHKKYRMLVRGKAGKLG